MLKTWPLKSAQGIEPLPSNVQKKITLDLRTPFASSNVFYVFV